MPRFIFASLILISLVFVGCTQKGRTVNQANGLLQQCPDVLVENKMPCPCSTDTCDECRNPAREYYIVDGDRRELSEFDNAWIKSNCNLKTEVVY